MQKIQQDQQQRQQQHHQPQFSQPAPAFQPTFQSPFQSIAQPQPQPAPTFGAPFQAVQTQQPQFGFGQTQPSQPAPTNLFSQLVNKTAVQPAQQPATFGNMNQNGFQAMNTNSFGNQSNGFQMNPAPSVGFNAPFFNTAPAQPLAQSSQMNAAFSVGGGGQSKGHYSNMNELSEQDMKEFNSNQFTIGRVPNNPPPRNLC